MAAQHTLKPAAPVFVFRLRSFTPASPGIGGTRTTELPTNAAPGSQTGRSDRPRGRRRPPIREACGAEPAAV
jgi:hypothetical protein